MSNIYTKSMSRALQEARDFRDTSDIEEGKGFLKKEVITGKGSSRSSSGTKYDSGGEPQPITIPVGLEKGTGNKSWSKKVLDKLKNALITFGEEVELTEEDANKLMNLMNDGLNEIVGGQGEMTITQDDKVMIIKTKDWQTYKAKGWVKRTNESLDLSATGDTITSNASQEDEGEELTEAWNEKLSIKSLAEYRKVYNLMKKAGIPSHFIKQMEKFYDDLVIGGMYSSRSAEERGILKIDGRTKYKNANW